MSRLRSLLLPLGLLFCLWGCDDSAAPPGRRGAAGGSLETQIAQLLNENVPFEFDFDLEDVNGQRLAKKDFAGKVLIVDLWGTWCPPCREEIPHFIALNHKYHDQGLRVVGLNYERVADLKQAARQVREASRQFGIDYPCALLPRNVADQVPDMGAFPTTLFIDRAGTVRLMVVGLHDLPFLQAVVETLLQEAPPASSQPSEKKDEESADGQAEP